MLRENTSDRRAVTGNISGHQAGGSPYCSQCAGCLKKKNARTCCCIINLNHCGGYCSRWPLNIAFPVGWPSSFRCLLLHPAMGLLPLPGQPDFVAPVPGSLWPTTWSTSYNLPPCDPQGTTGKCVYSRLNCSVLFIDSDFFFQDPFTQAV